MVQAVVLGLVGVLDSMAAVRRAEIDAFVDWIAARGGRRDDAAGAAASGAPGWQSAALRAAGLAPQSQLACEGVQHARAAAPPCDPTALRAWMEPVRGVVPVTFLESGPRARLDAWCAALGTPAGGVPRVWTRDLGADAEPPRPLAFRWLARRLDLPAHACLYVAGRAELAAAARAAGWQQVLLSRPLDPGFDWDAALAGRLGAR